MTHIDHTASRILDIVRGDPVCPEIPPLSWLASLIQDSRERGPRPDDEDPQAWHEMLREVSDMHRRLMDLLKQAGGSPGVDLQEASGAG